LRSRDKMLTSNCGCVHSIIDIVINILRWTEDSYWLVLKLEDIIEIITFFFLFLWILRHVSLIFLFTVERFLPLWGSKVRPTAFHKSEKLN
jgi:uncharacterized membrane protein